MDIRVFPMRNEDVAKYLLMSKGDRVKFVADSIPDLNGRLPEQIKLKISEQKGLYLNVNPNHEVEFELIVHYYSNLDLNFGGAQ